MQRWCGMQWDESTRMGSCGDADPGSEEKRVEGCEARPRPGEHEKGAQHSKYIYRLQVTNSHGKIFNVEKHTRSWNKLARSIYICMHASRKKYIISPLLFERNLYHPSYFRKQEQVAQ